MEIVNIFAYRLFAFRYDSELDDEYSRLMNLWTDTEYVRDFLIENEQDIPLNKTKKQFVEYIREDALYIDEQLIKIIQSDGESLSNFFRPLHNSEFHLKVLSLQKGRQHSLRLYAVKIDEDTFVITGGAIKLPLHHLMEDRTHTRLELDKLNSAKDYLRKKGIFDDDSFFEFLNED
jgi:hypothetical protein